MLPFLLPAVLSFAVFILIYRYVPNAPSSFKAVWPGALLATLLFEALKNGFALYIANFNKYAGAYGALGGILLFLLWMYLSANVLLIGAELASESTRALRGDYDEEEHGEAEDRTLAQRALRTVRGLFVQQKDEPVPPGDESSGG